MSHPIKRTKYARAVFVKHWQYAPGGNKVEKAIFSFKVTVKVTRSLTLVSFVRASFWSILHAKYELYSLLRFS